jgi:hypothetical protein
MNRPRRTGAKPALSMSVKAAHPRGRPHREVQCKEPAIRGSHHVRALDAGAGQGLFEPQGETGRVVDHRPLVAATDVADRVDRVAVAARKAVDVGRPRQAGAAHAVEEDDRLTGPGPPVDAGRACVGVDVECCGRIRPPLAPDLVLHLDEALAGGFASPRGDPRLLHGTCVP